MGCLLSLYKEYYQSNYLFSTDKISLEPTVRLSSISFVQLSSAALLATRMTHCFAVLTLLAISLSELLDLRGRIQI